MRNGRWTFRGMMLRKPNFFILGAPKCGTTSLAAWLSEHPQILIPRIKEPHFFNTDDKRGTVSLQEYEKLFAEARSCHKAIGEASVWYLYSSTAVTNILQYQPQARFIVMIRDPVEMAPALHADMVLSGHENVREFELAWALQEQRRLGRKLPAFSWAARRLLYGDVCRLGEQVARLLSLVTREKVLTVCLDELASDPRRDYVRVLQFLGVDDDGRRNFPIYNRARTMRWPVAARFLFVLLQLKERLGLDLNFDLWSRFREFNLREETRKSVSPQIVDMLRRYFASDVVLLGRMIGQDLTRWSDSSGQVHVKRDEINESISY
jgi:hypothetical protein